MTIIDSGFADGSRIVERDGEVCREHVVRDDGREVKAWYALRLAGSMRFASIEAPSVRVIGCTMASAKVVEVDGKRYRAHPYTDDGVPCVAWDLSDEIKDGE